MSDLANRTISATEGWTPLEFYAFIVRSVGIPDKFRFNFESGEWEADGPFTVASDKTLAYLDAHGV